MTTPPQSPMHRAFDETHRGYVFKCAADRNLALIEFEAGWRAASKGAPNSAGAPRDSTLEHAERLLREAARELMDGISLRGVPQWEDEPATEAAYLDHVKAADGLAGLLSINQWISVDERLPESDKPVLLDIGKKFPIRAMWAAKHTVEASDECPDDWAEYSEAEDVYYCPEGWYEWNEHEETHWSVAADKARAWMDLPSPPSTNGEPT